MNGSSHLFLVLAQLCGEQWPPFTDEETKTQKGYSTCTRSHTLKGGRAHVQTHAPELLAFCTMLCCLCETGLSGRSGIRVLKAWGEATWRGGGCDVGLICQQQSEGPQRHQGPAERVQHRPGCQTPAVRPLSVRGEGGDREDGAGTSLEVLGLDCERGGGGRTPGGETRRGRLRGGKGGWLQGLCSCFQEVVNDGCQQALSPEDFYPEVGNHGSVLRRGMAMMQGRMEAGRGPCNREDGGHREGGKGRTHPAQGEARKGWKAGPAPGHREQGGLRKEGLVEVKAGG